MTTAELWNALEAVLRDKGATDAWIEYALGDLQIAASQFAFSQYGAGHRDACAGKELPNPGPDDKPMVIVTEADGSRWLSLDAQAPPLSADSPEAREQLAKAFASEILDEDDTLLDGFGPSEGMLGGNA